MRWNRHTRIHSDVHRAQHETTGQLIRKAQKFGIWLFLTSNPNYCYVTRRTTCLRSMLFFFFFKSGYISIKQLYCLAFPPFPYRRACGCVEKGTSAVSVVRAWPLQAERAPGPWSWGPEGSRPSTELSSPRPNALTASSNGGEHKSFNSFSPPVKQNRKVGGGGLGGEEKQAANLQVGNKTEQRAENREVDFYGTFYWSFSTSPPFSVWEKAGSNYFILGFSVSTGFL